MQTLLPAGHEALAAREDADCIRFSFRWPAAGPAGEYDNFFIGAWHPTRAIAVDWGAAGAVEHAVVRGRQWALASAVSPLHGSGRGLVHSSAEHGFALAFRGYLCEPALHSYSPAGSLVHYWIDRSRPEHNGVFTAALIADHGATLTLTTDALGFAPLYFRRLAGAVLFSTNPRFLVVADDSRDLLAWRCLLESGFIGAERTLVREVQRLPAGRSLKASGDRFELTSWLELEQLGRGERPLDRSGVAEVERAFQEAMDRCLQLQDLEVLLPLSSGHDSRRMLAALVHRKRPLQAVTCRVFHKGRDLDARFAAEMAREFGFEHMIVEPPDPLQFAVQDRVRRLLTDTETGMHSWVPGFMRALPTRPAMVLDGIAGDVLGNPGFRIAGLYERRDKDIDIMLDASLPNAFERLLRRGTWPPASQVREDLREYLRTLPQQVNLAEFAFLLLRQRRTTAPWSQQLLPPGHVPVCPFLDLHYLRLLFSFVPEDKHATVLQRRCLAEFWPEYYRYPGTRDIPANSPRQPADFYDEAELACTRTTLEEIDCASKGELNGLLSPYGRLLLLGARLSHRITLRTMWQLQTLLELAARRAQQVACWRAEH